MVTLENSAINCDESSHSCSQVVVSGVSYLRTWNSTLSPAAAEYILIFLLA